jgi:hypothetical protein
VAVSGFVPRCRVAPQTETKARKQDAAQELPPPPRPYSSSVTGRALPLTVDSWREGRGGMRGMRTLVRAALLLNVHRIPLRLNLEDGGIK